MKKDLQYGNRKNILKDYCRICCALEQLEYHRMDKDGPYSFENVVILCREHHMEYHKIERNEVTLTPDEIMEKLWNKWIAIVESAYYKRGKP